MKTSEIKVGGTYLTKVTNSVVPVRLDRENPHGGWDATNLVTNKRVRIKTAQRLRGPANRKTESKDIMLAASAPVPKATKPVKDATPAKAAKPQATREPKAGKMSALDAAAKVLGESATPMTTGEMIEAMAAKGLWTSPGGKTPAATLYSAILRELKVKGAASRFTKTERGKFALAAKS